MDRSWPLPAQEKGLEEVFPCSPQKRPADISRLQDRTCQGSPLDFQALLRDLLFFASDQFLKPVLDLVETPSLTAPP